MEEASGGAIAPRAVGGRRHRVADLPKWPAHKLLRHRSREASFARCAGTVTSYELVNHGHGRRVYSIRGKRLVPDKAQSVADLGRTILATPEVNLIIIGGNQWNHCLGS